MPLDALFDPITIRNVTIKNRIVSTGHQTVMATDGKINDRLIAYHEARAAGGVGLIITEMAAAHESGFFSTHTIRGFSDDCIEGYQRLADVLHGYGCRVFGQITHPGREIYGFLADGRRAVAYAPSATPPERFLVSPRPMSLDMIREVVEGHASSALRLKAAGLDGIEIAASHGYLPAQFLNPHVNLRDDEYGGDFTGRSRFLREVCAAVRHAVGEQMVVGTRLSIDEGVPEGLQSDEMLKVVAALDDDGAIDYYNVTSGSSSTLGGAIHIVPPMRVKTECTSALSRQVKQVTARPVFVTGRINQPQIADAILRRGDADMCGMTRALICDPDMPAKAEANSLDDVRACIACNQACIGHLHLDAPISCIQHPETGREQLYGRHEKAPEARTVAVIGGGPAGMKAAAVAATRGHRVHLFEREKRLGGQALLAQLLPGRAEFGGIVTNLSREVERAGVEIHMGVSADWRMLRDLAPAAVVLATGATPRQPAIDGEGCHILTAWDVINGTERPGSSVLISDTTGDWLGFGVAEMLVLNGHRVRYVTSCPVFGQALQSYLRDQWVGELSRLGVELLNYHRLSAADSETVYLQHVSNDEYREIPEVDTIVVSHGNLSSTSLEDAMPGGFARLLVIGDCLSPRTAEEAVYDGLVAGASV